MPSHETQLQILTDSVIYVGREAPLEIRVMFGLLSGNQRLVCHGLFRLMTRDRKALLASIERVCEWDLTRIVSSHGRVVDGGAGAEPEPGRARGAP